MTEIPKATKAVFLFTHLSRKGGQNLQRTTPDLGPLALSLTELIPVRDPVEWQNMELLVFWYVTHCTVIFLC